MMNYVLVVHLYFRKFKWFYRGSALSFIGLLKHQSFFYVLVYSKSSLLWTSSGLFKIVHYKEVFNKPSPLIEAPLFHKLFEKFYWYFHRKTVQIQDLKIRIYLISLYAGVKISYKIVWKTLKIPEILSNFFPSKTTKKLWALKEASVSFYYGRGLLEVLLYHFF